MLLIRQPAQNRLAIKPNRAIGNRKGRKDTNATVRVAEAMPNDRRRVGPQQATPVRRAGTADRTLWEGFILHSLREV